MKKPILAFILLLLISLNVSAQDVAVSEKLKTYFHIPLSISGKNILVLSYEKGDITLESWNKALTIKKPIAEIDLTELKEIGEPYLTDAFITHNKLVIVQSVFSRNPNIVTEYIGQYDLEGNNLQSWEKLGEIERTNRIDLSFDWIHALSPDRSKYIFAVTSTKSKENAKYVLAMYDFTTNKVVLETSIQTEFHVETIDRSLLSLNDQGDYALWVGGEMDQLSRKSESNKDVHHLYHGNSKTTEIKGYPLEIPNKLIGSTSILVKGNGDVLAVGMTQEDLKEPIGLDGYYTAVLKNGTESFDFQTYPWRPEIVQRYYTSHKVEVLQTLPKMKTKEIFVHESGEMTFVSEEYYLSVYTDNSRGTVETTEVFGSLFAVRMDASGKVIQDDLVFKYRRSADMQMPGSLAFLSNDTLRIIFSEHSDIWQGGKRVMDLSGLKQAQPYYCSLTCAKFGANGFTFDQMDTKQGKKMCVHLYATSFLGENTILGIGREGNALHFIRMALP